MDKGGGGGGAPQPRGGTKNKSPRRGPALQALGRTSQKSPPPLQHCTPNSPPNSQTSTFGGTLSSQGSLQSSAPPSRGGESETRTPRAQKTPRTTERHQGQGRESPYAQARLPRAGRQEKQGPPPEGGTLITGYFKASNSSNDKKKDRSSRRARSVSNDRRGNPPPANS
jgi:hypothetical protein